jgi:hypothetical protein
MSGCNSSLRQDFIALERHPPESLLSVAASVTKVDRFAVTQSADHGDAARRMTLATCMAFGGGFAWRDNARLRAAGERRILKEFPDHPRGELARLKEAPGGVP